MAEVSDHEPPGAPPWYGRWWLLECGHYGKGQARGRNPEIQCRVCDGEPSRLVVKRVMTNG